MRTVRGSSWLNAVGRIVPTTTLEVAAGELTRRHDAETLTQMILGAYYVLMFSFANVDDFPIRRQARAAAEFLADALAPVQQE